jgi:site-specific recombinase XerD
MTLLAPTLQGFFTDRLARQRQASPRTIAAYRDALRLLLTFVHQQTGTTPAKLDWNDLNADVISAFLNHLEDERGNSTRTRNVRLTAIRSLFSYAALQHPEHALLIQRVLDIPPKRFDKRTVTFLTGSEVNALLAAPDPKNWEGRRDKAMIALAVQTGLRVSELIGLNCDDITLGYGAAVRCEGKGRKQRTVPLDQTVQNLLRSWLTERAGHPRDPLFCTRTGRRLSRDAVAQRLNTHTQSARRTCPSLQDKDVHPHVLRHSCAMSLLQAGVDTTVIALWLGHAGVRSTDAYVHADMTIKEKALALTTPASTLPGCYQPSDKILAFLDRLQSTRSIQAGRRESTHERLLLARRRNHLGNE